MHPTFSNSDRFSEELQKSDWRWPERLNGGGLYAGHGDLSTPKMRLFKFFFTFAFLNRRNWRKTKAGHRFWPELFLSAQSPRKPIVPEKPKPCESIREINATLLTYGGNLMSGILHMIPNAASLPRLMTAGSRNLKHWKHWLESTINQLCAGDRS